MGPGRGRFVFGIGAFPAVVVLVATAPVPLVGVVVRAAVVMVFAGVGRSWLPLLELKNIFYKKNLCFVFNLSFYELIWLLGNL